MLENILGRGRFLLLYLGSLLGGSLFVLFFAEAPTLGASGAVLGLIAGIFTMAYRKDPVLSAYNTRAIVESTGRNLVLNLIFSFSARVSWQAHIGGMLAAALMAGKIVRDAFALLWLGSAASRSAVHGT